METNTIRPAMLGFHDGLVSITVMMLTLLSTEGASSDLVKSGLAAAFAGALSMSLGEFSSVSTAVENGLTHESPTTSSVSSFISFIAGSSIPLLVVHYGGGVLEMVSAVGLLVLSSSLVNKTDIRRTSSIVVFTISVSLLFGRVMAH